MARARDRTPVLRRIASRVLAGFAVLAALAAAAREVPSPGGPAVRLPEGEFASDAWDLIARFQSGHLVFSQAVVTNLGWGDHKAAVVGLVVTPDQKVQVFRRSEDEHGWKLSRDGLKMDLRSIVFDRRGSLHRLDVGKDEFELRVEWKPSHSPVWPAVLPQRCPIEIHEIASEAQGSLWSEGMAGPTPLEGGRVALTHRWTAELEASCLVRRTELYVLEPDVGLYFTEIATPDGATHRWVALERAGNVVYQGAPERAQLTWRSDASGYPALQSADVTAAGVRLRANASEPFFSFDLLDRVPMPFRSALATRTRPRLMLARAHFMLELTNVGPGRAPAAQQGNAVVKIDYANPLAAQAQPPAGAGTGG
jgi:hypothetical protein